MSLVCSLRFTELISKCLTSLTDWESDEVCNLCDGQSPLVEEEGEAACLAVWYFSSPSLSSSLQACFYMWPHGIIIMVLGEHEHFFCLHLSFSPPTHPRWSGRWTEWEQCEMNAEKTCDSAVQQGAAEWKGNYSPCALWHQVAVPSEMRRGPLRMELCSPPSMAKALRILFSRTYFK